MYDHKIKKQPGEQVIELERTKDILLELGQKKEKQILIGFAAETDILKNMHKKNLGQKMQI